MIRSAVAFISLALSIALARPAAASAPADPLAEGARDVVRAVVRAARINAARPERGEPGERPPYRLTGDSLTVYYVRAAAVAAVRLPAKQAAGACLVGLGLALDDSTILRDNPLTSQLCRRVESDAERKARLEVLGEPTLRGRRDWAQHFVVSCALTEIVGPKLAERAGILKEQMDLLPGGTGFSFADLAADLAGIDFALRLKRSEIELESLRTHFLVKDHVPALNELPEDFTAKQFSRDYGSVTDRRFLAAVAAIRKRIKTLPGRAKPRARLPNLVVVLADDLGYGDPRCYNKKSGVPTPNLDRLAAQGMRFTDAHTPAAVCSPTRYGLLTGRYPWRSSLKRGVLHGYSPLLIEPGRMTVASLLKRHGYATGCVGKWHLGLGSAARTDYARPLRPGPTTVGFDYFFGIPASLDMPPYVFVANDRVTAAPTEKIGDSGMRRNGGAGFWRAGAIAPGFRHADVLPRLTDRAVGFLRKQTKAKPFFLYLAFSAPHTPWLPTKPFRGKSTAGPYGDFVAQVDDSLGQVLAALKETGLAEDTLVIFTSDNGAHWLPGDVKKWDHRANDGWRGQKADVWDGGHRVPFLVRWPGKVAPGTVRKEPICLTDLLATTAAIVGAKLPADAGEDSFDLLPILRGCKLDRPIHEAIVHQAADGTLGIRQGPWKLAMALGSHGFSAPRDVKPKPGGPKGQLYNLDEDPGERKNLWLEKPAIVKRLTALLEKYKREGRSRFGG